MKNIFLCIALIGILTISCKRAEQDQLQNDFSEYKAVKLSEIQAQGWLAQLLELQSEGLTGNIEAAGYPFNTGMWTTRIQLDTSTEKEQQGSFERDGAAGNQDEGVFWWPYEQTGYYIDGALKCAYLTGDTALMSRALYQINYLLEHPRNDGRLGTVKMIGRWFNWPYVGLFRAFMTEYTETGNEGIIDAMEKHYTTFSAEDFQDELDVCNVEILCWLFQIKGDSSFLQMAEESYALFKAKRENRNRDGNDIDFLSDRIPDYHGVVYFEIVKLPAMLYAVTGKKKYLEESLHGIRKMEEHFMLASGVPSTTEHFHEINERAGHESCNLATLPYTYGVMMKTTGQADWGDKIEKAVYNAGLGSVTKDFKAHQYFSAPNQMISTTQTQHFGYYPSNMAYAPGQTVACCTGNINRFMPYYVMQMWMKTKNNGIAACLLGPSILRTSAGIKNKAVEITQETAYPFEEKITFILNTEGSVQFEFRIRIPSWCQNPEISINGEKSDQKPVAGSFYSIDRKWNNRDIIEVFLPMHIETKFWPNEGVSIERGPLVFSFPVPDSTVIAEGYEKSTDEFPAYDMFPAGAWEYGLEISDPNEFEVQTYNKGDYPWQLDSSPIKIRVPARRISNWTLQAVDEGSSSDARYHVSMFPEIPEFSAEKEMIELVPYGATELRVTVFPRTPGNKK